MVNFSRQSHNAVVKWLWTVDKVTLFVALALLVIGVILDITASPAIARKLKLDDFALVRKQIKFVVLSCGIMLGMSLFSLQTVRRVSILGFVVLWGLLVWTFLFGAEIKGARRWIYLCGFSLQPSELMKPIFIVWTAWLLERSKKLDYFKGWYLALSLIHI